MKTFIAAASVALVGIVFGVLANYSILQGAWLNLLLWALVGILIGLFIEERRWVRQSGTIYGLSVTVSFLFSDFHGTWKALPGFLILSVGLGLLGAFCGYCLVSASYWFKRKVF